MKKSLLVILFLCIGFWACKTSQTNSDDNPKLQTAISQSTTLIQKTIEEESFPGLAVAVAQNGKLLWSKGFAWADIENRKPIDPAKSQFRIGSISKPFTAAGLAKLYETGKVNLDVPIQTYVPDFPKKQYDINLRQLAGHIAGIRHYRGQEFMSNKKYETVKEGLTIFADDPLLFEPGTKYAYSSYAWNLISAAMETAADQDFLSFMQEKVFQPLNMDDTEPDYADQDIKDRVQFYVLSNNKLTQAPYVDNSYKWAGGGFISTAEDVIKFANAHLQAGYLKQATLDLWIASQQTKDGKPTNYGIGWRSGEDNKGRKWYGHSGGSIGGTSYMLIYPKEKLVVVTLVNLSSARLRNLPFRIGNQFLTNNQ